MRAPDLPDTGDGALLSELTRMKALFQLRTLTTIITGGIPSGRTATPERADPPQARSGDNADFLAWLFSRCDIARAGFVTPCWLWQGELNHARYAKTRLPKRFRDAGHRGRARIHRVAYLRFVGPIAEGLVTDHLCNNRSCCNPAHLEPVTQAVNTRRIYERGKRHAIQPQILRAATGKPPSPPKNARPTKANGQKRPGAASIYQGVTRSRSRWAARIKNKGCSIWIGTFDGEREAADAYDSAVRAMFGVLGTYNFPREGEQSAHRHLGFETPSPTGETTGEAVTSPGSSLAGFSHHTCSHLQHSSRTGGNS